MVSEIQSQPPKGFLLHVKRKHEFTIGSFIDMRTFLNTLLLNIFIIDIYLHRNSFERSAYKHHTCRLANNSTILTLACMYVCVCMRAPFTDRPTDWSTREYDTNTHVHMTIRCISLWYGCTHPCRRNNIAMRETVMQLCTCGRDHFYYSLSLFYTFSQALFFSFKWLAQFTISLYLPSCHCGF